MKQTMAKLTKAQDKTQLIAAIQSLLHNEAFETQEDICHALKKQGFDVTQVSISRLINKLGAIKINENHKMVYRLPVEMVSITASNSLSQLILNIACNETLIVIHVAPGSAQLVARLLDQKTQLGILGTIAGDDTIAVIPMTVAKIDVVMKNISALLYA